MTFITVWKINYTLTKNQCAGKKSEESKEWDEYNGRAGAARSDLRVGRVASAVSSVWSQVTH